MSYKSKKGDRVFVSWSGGKDSYLALLKAMEEGLKIDALLTFIGSDGFSRSHGVHADILKKQAELLGIYLHTETVSWESYEAGFEQAVELLKAERKISGGVFGDINLEEHRQWVENKCRDTAINCNLPLWMMDEKAVSELLIEKGAKALIVAIRNDLVDEKWLGQFMDQDYLAYCNQAGISPCGERGEAHTLVVDGPLFSSPLPFKTGDLQRRDNHSLIKLSLS